MSSIIRSGHDLEAAVVLIDSTEMAVAIRHEERYFVLAIPSPHNDPDLVLDQRMLANATTLMLVSTIIDPESPNGADVLTLRFGPGWCERVPELSGNPALLPRSINDASVVVGILNDERDRPTGAIWSNGRCAALDDLTGAPGNLWITNPLQIDTCHRIHSEAIDATGAVREVVLQPLAVN